MSYLGPLSALGNMGGCMVPHKLICGVCLLLPAAAADSLSPKQDHMKWKMWLSQHLIVWMIIYGL